MDQKNNGQKQDPNRNRQFLLILLICALVSMLCMSAFSGMFNETSTKKITYDAFIEMLDKGQVDTVIIRNDSVEITPKTQKGVSPLVHYYATRTEDMTALTARLEKAGVKFSGKETSVISEFVMTVLSFVVPFALFMILINLMMGRT